MAQRVLGQIHRHASDPGRRIIRHATHRPRPQRAQQSFLRHIFGESQILQPDETNERAMQTTCLVAKEMFHQLRRSRESWCAHRINLRHSR